jgi:DNA-binding transcriptional LysR family regulator
MDVRVLRYFVTVAREGSVTRAANFLHVTQPTLSRQIKELEEELGRRLFVRSNYSIKLTEEGMLLRKRAEDILDLVDKTKAEFGSLHDITGGDIRIGAAETYTMDYIANVVENLSAQYPNIQYHLYSGNYEEVTERLDKGLLDFCLLVDPVDVAKYNQISLPAKDTWGLVMRSDSPLAEKKSIRPNDLIDLPLICSRQSLTHELSSWFGEKLDKIRIVATYNLAYNASVLVNRGIGYLMCFDRLVNTSEESNLIFRPLRPKLESSLSIVWKKYQVFSPAQDLFLIELQSMFSEQKND